MAAARHQGRGPEPIRKWKDAIEAYLALQETLVRSGSLSARAAARYQTSIVQLSHALEGTPLTDITTATVFDFVLARRAEERSSSTIRNGLKTRTIHLGRAAAMLARLPAQGRLFPHLSEDSAVVSTRSMASGTVSARPGRTGRQPLRAGYRWNSRASVCMTNGTPSPSPR